MSCFQTESKRADSKLPSAQNNVFAKVAYFGVAYSVLFQHVQGANKTGVPKIRMLFFL